MEILEKIALWAVPVILAVTMHEVAHGIVASLLGDNTARRLGRLSLNPFRHIDPVGSLLIPGLLLFFGGFMFGWARAVPVDASNFIRPRRDMAMVAAAGPFANLLMVFCWALTMKLGLWVQLSNPAAGQLLLVMGAAGIFINTALMMLNLLPLLPLDGGRVLVYWLPESLSVRYKKIEPFGFGIILLLIISGVLSKILWPLMVLGMAIFTHITGISVDVLTASLALLF